MHYLPLGVASEGHLPQPTTAHSAKTLWSNRALTIADGKYEVIVLALENWFVWLSDGTEVIEALDYVVAIFSPFFNCLLGNESIDEP